MITFLVENRKSKMFEILNQKEHSAILLTFIKQPFVIKTFVLSIFEWLLKTDFTVTISCIKNPHY